MKSVSNDFKQAAIAPVKESFATVTVFNNDGTTTVYSASDVLQSVSIEATGELFGTYASQATIKLLGIDYQSLLNADIDILYQLVVNESPESIDYGHFIIFDIQTDFKKGTTTLKANSQMLQLQEQDYSPMEGFPMTLGQMTQKIADDFGLTLDDISGLPNINRTIEEDLYANINGANYRNVLAEIAGATGSMAIIDRIDSTLYFRPYQSVVQQTMDYSYLKSYNKGLHYGPVNSLVLSRTPQEDNVVIKDDASIATYGLTEVKLANNEIMDDDRESFATPLFNAISGMEWNGFEIETVGLGWLECGDRVSITDEDNNTIEGIITYIKVTFDGGVKEIIKAVPPINTETNYALAGGITKTIYNTEIKVDKQNQEIQSIVESQETFENQVINNFTNVTQNINSVVTSVQASGGSNLIKNSAFFTSDDSGRFTEWNYGTSSTILPEEYQQVEYIESNGTQYITTNINPSTISNLAFDTKAQFIEDSISSWKTIFGIAQGGDDGNGETIWAPQINFAKRGTYGTIAIEYDNALRIDSNILWGTIPHSVSANISSGNSSITVDGTLASSSSATFTELGPNGFIDIFGRPFAVETANYDSHINIFASSIRLYSLDFSTNNNLIHNYIPCYRLQDGSKGLYDTVENLFYQNLATGEDFIAGQAIGIPIVEPSGEAQAYGSLSGQIIHLEDISISQTISVKADDDSILEDNKTYYSFSCRVKKSSAGTASITLTDGTTEGIWQINLSNGEESLWQEFYLDAILPQSNELTITAQGSASSDFQITDMMLCVGNYHTQWQQASGESNNTQVSITTEGITVKNGNLASTWTKHTTQSFDVYKNRKLTSGINSDEVFAPSARFTDEIDMKPIKIVQQDDGWAFVKLD